MRSAASTAIVLDSRRKKKDATFPVKLRITFQRIQKYYGIGVSLSEADFKKAMAPRPRNEFKELKLSFSGIEEKASEVIQGMQEFSFPAFEKAFFSKRQDRRNVYQTYEAYIEGLTAEDRIGTAQSYHNSLRSIQTFQKNRSLAFIDITPDLLQEYEKWMLKKGNSISTVGIYLRALRTIINIAKRDGTINETQYPFGKHKYQIPASRNIKKALLLDDIRKIIKHPSPAGSPEARARDFWVFSYLCNGINIKDLARLKYQNIEGESIIFVRAKTERTSRQSAKPIVIALLPESLQVIETWGNQPQKPESFVFPILEPDLSPRQELARIKQETKQINKYMRRIGAALGIEQDITTYTARHSFSTVMKRSGASIEFISESLGHKDVSTTERYLDSFEDGMRKEFAKKLL